MNSSRALLGAAVSAALLGFASVAAAQTPPATSEPSPLVPKPVVSPPVPEPPSRALFTADPVADGAILGISGAMAVLSSLLVGTTEIRPQAIDSSFSTSSLLSIDRGAVTQHPDPNAATYSNVALYGMLGYAFVDPILSGVRQHDARTTLVDFMIYGEALAITESLTNLAKFAVRRPRPYAYIQFNLHKNDPNYDNTSTDSALSFFSGHASACGTITATATYLAFARSPNSWRPWVTLFVGTGITTFVDIERVRAADHFPTDVITGTLVGAGVGVLTVHLHRIDDQKPKAMWVGWQPARYGEGGALTLNGTL